MSEVHQTKLVESLIECNIPNAQSLLPRIGRTRPSNTTLDMNRTPTDTQESVPSFGSNTLANDRAQQSIECTQMETTNPSMTSNFQRPLLLSDTGDIDLPFHTNHLTINSSFSLDSPTFRTSNNGYVFKLRVCSTPQSIHHKQDYLSIYLTLYSSPYDPILVYPFPYNMTLYLLDGSDQRRHIKGTIKADQNSPVFACPSGEKNDEVGVTEFCPLNYLTQNESIYFKDDVFFVRVSFDFMKISSNMNN